MKIEKLVLGSEQKTAFWIRSDNLLWFQGNKRNNLAINNVKIYANTNWKFHSPIWNAVIKSSFQILEQKEISIINTFVVLGVEVEFFPMLVTQNICWREDKTVFSPNSVILSKTHSSHSTYFSNSFRMSFFTNQEQNHPCQLHQLFNSSIILWTKWWISW